MGPLVVERISGVALLRISRPEKRNALTLAMLTELVDLVGEEISAGALAVILAGDDEVFSAGVDLSALGNGIDDVHVDDLLATAIAQVRATPVPIVAAIEGPCIGGAVELVLACDARVAAEGSFFAVPATQLGLLYRPEGIASLVAHVGRDTVSRLLLFNERLGSSEALRAGLATHTCVRGAAVEMAFALCEGISRATPTAVSATKELICELLSDDSDLSHWSARRETLLASDERREALAHATQRRKKGD
ncbi:MAG: enoyl-CoA hydratase/isomerase family protein [Acidimicrobiaceae bacterium]|nr:enoyl-CoA hydratase/isomerase family protein [Acidimicrobiaceae bacterium]